MISQDPYPYGQADGLAFSTSYDETPFSLRMIFRELDRNIIKTKDYKEYKASFTTNSLESWAKEGVLLLNRVLTVRSEETNSHKEIGWQQFTDKILELLWHRDEPVAFVLWGSEAKKALEGVVSRSNLASDLHLILDSGHPASGSHGKDKFSGNGHFAKINHWLKRRGQEPINWELNDKRRQKARS